MALQGIKRHALPMFADRLHPDNHPLFIQKLRAAGGVGERKNRSRKRLRRTKFTCSAERDVSLRRTMAKLSFVQSVAAKICLVSSRVCDSGLARGSPSGAACGNDDSSWWESEGKLARAGGIRCRIPFFASEREERHDVISCRCNLERHGRRI